MALDSRQVWTLPLWIRSPVLRCSRRKLLVNNTFQTQYTAYQNQAYSLVHSQLEIRLHKAISSTALNSHPSLPIVDIGLSPSPQHAGARLKILAFYFGTTVIIAQYLRTDTVPSSGLCCSESCFGSCKPTVSGYSSSSGTQTASTHSKHG